MLRMMTTAATLIALSVPAHAEIKGAGDAMQDTGEAMRSGTADPGGDLSGAAGNRNDEVARFDATAMQAPEGWAQVTGGAWTADELAGLPLYDAGNTRVGEIDTVVITADGDLKGAVLGVGGFLGLGEKDVLVSFDSLVFRQAQDGGEIRVYADVTREGLEALPGYGS